MRKKKLPSTKEELARRQTGLIESLAKESDRGCVLVAAAVLDESLEQLLRAQMSNEPVAAEAVNALFAGQGPFATFWSKIQALFALGYLSPKIYSDLEAIRKIRNEFAHQYAPASFSIPEVQRLVASLESAASMLTFVTEPSRAEHLRRVAQAPSEKRIDGLEPSSERARFALAVGWIIGSIDAAIDFYRSVRARGELQPPCIVSAEQSFALRER